MARLRQYATIAEDEEPLIRVPQVPQVSNSGITWQQNASGEWVKFENDVVRTHDGYRENQTQLDDEWPPRLKAANGRKLPSLSVRTDLEGFVGLMDGPSRGRTGGSPGRSGGAPVPAGAGTERRLSGATNVTSSPCRSASREGGSPMRSDRLSSKGSSIPSQIGRMSSKGSSAVSGRKGSKVAPEGSSAVSERKGSKVAPVPAARTSSKGTSSKGTVAGVERTGSKEIALDRQFERMHPDGSSNDDRPLRMEYSSTAGGRNTTPRTQLQVPAGRRRSCPLPTVEPAGQVVIEAPKSTPRASQFRRKRISVADLDETGYESRPTPRASASFPSTAFPVDLEKQESSLPTPSTSSSTPAALRKLEEPEVDLVVDELSPTTSGQAAEELSPVVSPVRQDGRRASVRLLLENSEEVQPSSAKEAQENKRSDPRRGRTSLRSIMRQPPRDQPPPPEPLSPKQERLKMLRELHEAPTSPWSESPDFADVDRMTIGKKTEDDFLENFVAAR